MKKYPFMIFFIVLVMGIPAWTASPLSRDWDELRSNSVLQAELRGWVNYGLAKAFGITPSSLSAPKVSDFFRQSFPIFVTLQKNGEVRGCMGSLVPQRSNLAEEIPQKIELALFQDPRHRPVTKNELVGMVVFISTVITKAPVRSVQEISPAYDGVWLSAGSKGAVLMPGEAKTQRYLLALLKAKAGLKKGEAFHLYRLKTQSVKVIPDFPESNPSKSVDSN